MTKILELIFTEVSKFVYFGAWNDLEVNILITIFSHFSLWLDAQLAGYNFLQFGSNDQNENNSH